MLKMDLGRAGWVVIAVLFVMAVTGMCEAEALPQGAALP